MKTIKVKTNITNEEFDKDMIELGIMKTPQKTNIQSSQSGSKMIDTSSIVTANDCSLRSSSSDKTPKTPNEEEDFIIKEWGKKEGFILDEERLSHRRFSYRQLRRLGRLFLEKGKQMQKNEDNEIKKELCYIYECIIEGNQDWNETHIIKRIKELKRK